MFMLIGKKYAELCSSSVPAVFPSLLVSSSKCICQPLPGDFWQEPLFGGRWSRSPAEVGVWGVQVGDGPAGMVTGLSAALGLQLFLSASFPCGHWVSP